MLRKKDFYVNHGKCWFQAVSLKTELSLFLRLYFIRTWDWYEKKIYRFVEYIQGICFNKFVQSAVNARREGGEIPNSSVVAQTMKLLANSSYGYQIMDGRHTVVKYLSDEKTHAAINTKLFERLDHINDQLYEAKLAKAEI